MSQNGLKLSNAKLVHVLTSSPEETVALGQQIGTLLKPGDLLCLFGDLGAGKTTLIKGIIQALTGVCPAEVCSPTFSYLNIFEGNCPVYHFDLYRLRDAEDFLGMGFEEYFFAGGVCCLEWSERITDILPKQAYQVMLKAVGGERREISYAIRGCDIC